VNTLQRLLPAPWLSLALWAVWLMLNQSASVGNLLLGAALALALPWFTERFRPERLRIHAWGIALKLAGVVLADIIKSNVQVARLILGPESAITPRFVWVPLDIRDAHGIATLATVITMTPGTLSADLSDDRGHLLVHSFDCDDDAAAVALVADIKARYETPLIAIFEGRKVAP
jgi:multicomponent K+:H+ antiporter subunit E